VKLKILAASLALAIGISNSAFAADKQALAEQYATMPEVQMMMDDLFSAESMAAQISASLPPNVSLTDDKLHRIGVLMSDAMQELRPKIEQQMIADSAEVFTADELKALIAFYGSEHGAAIMGKMQPLMQKTMAGLTADIQRVTVQITPELVKIMQE